MFDLTKNSLCKSITKGLTTGVDNIAMSPDATILAASCIDIDRTVVFYKISNDSYDLILLRKLGSEKNILDLNWTSNSDLAVIGINLFAYIQCDLGEDGAIVHCDFKDGNDRVLVCNTKGFRDEIVCGSFNGELQVWSWNKCITAIKAHKGPLDALSVVKGDEYTDPVLLTGGKDGKIKLFDASYSQLKMIDLNNIIADSMEIHVRALAVNLSSKRLAVGLISSEIYEFAFKYALLTQLCRRELRALKDAPRGQSSHAQEQSQAQPDQRTALSPR